MEHSMTAQCSACRGGKCMYAEGGDVKEMPEDMGEMDESDSDDELMDSVCDELLSAIEKKDKKEILESLKAIILSVKG